MRNKFQLWIIFCAIIINLDLNHALEETKTYQLKPALKYVEDYDSTYKCPPPDCQCSCTCKQPKGPVIPPCPTPPNTYLPVPTTPKLRACPDGGTPPDCCANGGKGLYCCTNGANNPDCCKNGGKGKYCCTNGADNADCCKNGGKGKYCCTNGANNADCCLNGGKGKYCCTNGANNAGCELPTTKFRGPTYLPPTKSFVAKAPPTVPAARQKPFTYAKYRSPKYTFSYTYPTYVPTPTPARSRQARKYTTTEGYPYQPENLDVRSALNF